MPHWTDAHNHLQDPRLTTDLPGILSSLRSAAVTAAVVNGTRVADWNDVHSLAQQHDWIRPAYGLHPWYLEERPVDWKEQLETLLDHPGSSIGECGLDRWKPGLDFDLQMEVFRAHLEIARRRRLPVTIHCLRAWGPLLDVLHEIPPSGGFLLHSFSGPKEMIPAFVRLGGFFSFSGAFLHPRKTAARTAFQSVPRDRLLLETDAPDQPLPDALRTHPLLEANHPAHLPVIAAGLAELLREPLEELAGVTGENFQRLFRR